jgi:hypothetical protein
MVESNHDNVSCGTEYELSYECFNNVFKHISAYRRLTDRNTEILLKEAFNTIKLTKPDRNRTGYVIAESQLIGICCFSAKHVALRRKNKEWLNRITIMCPSGATCLPADCCFSELALK